MIFFVPCWLRDEREISDWDAVPAVVEVASVGVGDVVVVGVLLPVQHGVVVHRGGVVNLLSEPSKNELNWYVLLLPFGRKNVVVNRLFNLITVSFVILKLPTRNT